jgi:RNase P/RNase MRP subunit p29
MIGLMGKDVAVVACTDPIMVGLRGTVALESMHMIKITTSRADRTVSVQKKGTVLVLQDSGKVVVADEMKGRIEDRLARGYRL